MISNNNATRRWRERMFAEQRCNNCGNPNPRYPRRLCQRCQDRVEQKQKERRAELKRTVLLHYGNKCACCGEWRYQFLSIDHIANDGNQELHSGYHFYHDLIIRNFPAEFRVLCHNCNLGRHLNGGTCPHGNGI